MKFDMQMKPDNFPNAGFRYAIDQLAIKSKKYSITRW